MHEEHAAVSRKAKSTFKRPLTPCICFDVSRGTGATFLAVFGNLLQVRKTLLSTVRTFLQSC